MGRLLAQAGELGLLGTILLAPEGINLFLAGSPEAIRVFLRQLHADPRFAGLPAKESWSDATCVKPACPAPQSMTPEFMDPGSSPG